MDPFLEGLHLRLVPVLHVVRVVRHLLDHLLQQVVAREHRVQLALTVRFLEGNTPHLLGTIHK